MSALFHAGVSYPRVSCRRRPAAGRARTARAGPQRDPAAGHGAHPSHAPAAEPELPASGLRRRSPATAAPSARARTMAQLNPAPGFRIRRVVGGAGGHGVTRAGALQCQRNPKLVLSLRAGVRWGGRGGGGLSGSARLAHSPIASSESSRPLSPRPVAAARRNRARAVRVPSESRLFRVRAGRASRGGER